MYTRIEYTHSIYNVQSGRMKTGHIFPVGHGPAK